MATSPATSKKKPATPADKSTASPEPSITTIQKSTCKNLNGSAILDYHIGMDNTAALHWKIHANSGNGMFSQEWVAFADIQNVLNKWPKDSPIVSMALYPVYKGKSVNTPSFLLASLVNEGILQQVPDKKRHFQIGDAAPFLKSAEKWKGRHSGSSKPKPKTKRKAGARMSKAKAKGTGKTATGK